MGALEAVAEAGPSVPGDLSVAGYDSTTFRRVRPDLPHQRRPGRPRTGQKRRPAPPATDRGPRPAK
ncbi:hypothetical protein OG381_42650 [Streptomyces sp. NBC_00490]|uniref:hypothetical protein n=1 Tax=Streptomyces sp. NBC_00490 TaxID=2903657 RepID=UPI002E173B94